MYNMTLNEFGKLLREYEECEKYRKLAIEASRDGGVDNKQAIEYSRQHMKLRKEFVRKFRR